MKQLVRLPTIERSTGFKKSQIYRWIKDGHFPSPIKIGRASAWDAEEVARWIEARKAERDQAA